MTLKLFMALMFLSGCQAAAPSNAIEELAEQVIRRKEGIDIRMMSIEEEKPKNK